MARYAIINTADGQSLLDKDNGRFIPFDQENRHYQEYLRWVDAGNEADIE